jgi:putative glycosyltransferase
VKLSIVSTMYRSEPYIDEFYERMTTTASALTADYEIVLVDDGSPDDSLARSLAIARSDHHVKVVELSRNFGHHQAVVAGLSQAEGQRIFLIDIDLEEQPEWLLEFAAEQERSQADVVFGIQQQRVGSLVNRHLGKLFYKLFNAMSETKIPESACTVRLLTRDYVQALLTLRDRNLFLAGNFVWTGFDQVPIVVQRTRRLGKSTYTLKRTMRLYFDAISSFSSYPLRAIFITGLLMSTLSGLFGLHMLIRKLLNPDAVALGFSSIIVSIWFLGGLIIFFLGVIGLYLSKMFVEVKNRPQFIIRKVYRGAGSRAREAAPGSARRELAVDEAAPLK